MWIFVEAHASEGIKVRSKLFTTKEEARAELIKKVKDVHISSDGLNTTAQCRLYDFAHNENAREWRFYQYTYAIAEVGLPDNWVCNSIARWELLENKEEK